MTNLAETAMALARFGWPVFPCQPGGKTPCTDHGWQDASADPKIVAQWWLRWPSANIGIATGEPGPGVLDFDMDKKGCAPISEGYELLRVAGLLKGAGPIVQTRSGGWHLYFKGSTAGNAAYIGGYPIDYRGVGGYVITAPSRVDPGEYRVVATRVATGTFDLDAAKELLRPPPKPDPVYLPGEYDGDAGSAETLAAWVARREKGERHPGTWWALCKATETGYDQEPIIRAAVDELGLKESDIRRQAANAKRVAGI